MKRSKGLSAALACAMILSVFAGCSKKDDTPSGDVIPNVITSADNGGNPDGGNNSGGNSGGEQGDKNGGNAVTTTEGINNAVNTGIIGEEDDPEPDVPTTSFTLETEATAARTTPKELSEEEIEAALTAKVTSATNVMNSNVDSTTKYAYNTLSKDEKLLYDAIVESATKLTSKIRVSDAVTTEIWTKIFGMVYNQEPQLFWVNKKISVGRIYFNETDPDKIKSMQKEIDASVDKIMNEASGKSTFDKIKIFHDYLALNSTFQKTDTVGAYNESIYNAFKGGTSKQGSIQCAGYAKSMLYLCDKAGIDCMVITGTNDSGASHAWNKVKVDGEWYNLDCTWDDPIFTTPDFKYVKHTYFLVPDKWINNKTHYNINTKAFNSGKTIVYFDPPAATATAQNYFIKNSYVYNDAASAEAELKKQLENAASSGLSVAELMVGSKEVYKTMKGRLKDCQDYLKGKNSKVKGVADNSNEEMLLIQLDIKYK